MRIAKGRPFLRPLGVVVAVVAATLLAACNSAAGDQTAGGGPATVDTAASFAPDSTMAKLQKANKITIGTKFDQPLFGLKNPMTNKPEGFDVEIGKMLAAAMGISADNIEWVETVSANREPFIQQGRVDMVLATYTINEARKQIISFGGPYLVAGQRLMVKSGNPLKIQAPADLAGKKVCSVQGSASSTNIKQKSPNATVVLFDAYSKCADALKNGQVDAMTTDDTILAGLKSLDPDSFELVGEAFTKEPYGIGVKKDDPAFVTFIDDELTRSFQDGRWAKAWDATAGKVLGKAPAAPDLDSI